MTILFLAVVRAGMLSITIDEANTFNIWCRPGEPWHWFPAANNHTLNSILMRFCTYCFGLSIYTMRVGALVGAVIYLAGTYQVAVKLVQERWLRLALFLGLTVNPFVGDYLSVARGYGLALGFLMLAVAVLLEEFGETEADFARGARRGRWMAAWLALMVASNLSFSYLAVCLMGLYVGVVGRRRWLGLALRAAGPGLAVTLVLCGSALVRWTKSELYYGSKTVREMVGSLVGSTFYELNPEVVNPLLLRPLERMGGVLPWVFAGMAVVLLGVAVWRRERTSLVLAASVLGAFLLHWLAWKLLKIPLPKERTGIFFVPMAMLVFTSATVAARWRALRVAGTVVMLLGAVYFAGCLRLSHTREWKFDADTRELYETVRRLNGVHEVTVNWEFHEALKVYAKIYRETERFDFQGYEGGPPPTGKAVYVLNEQDYEDLKGREKLKVVYRGEMAQSVVAVPGE